jgi:hypothetical protein
VPLVAPEALHARRRLPLPRVGRGIAHRRFTPACFAASARLTPISWEFRRDDPPARSRR